MSILGYSSAYFLPQYWANTPLYGEKIIPLLDYVLSTDYQHTSKLASAFYDIESKYRNTQDLPIDKIEAIIEESGYGYVRDLLGQDEESIRLLVYTLVLINELKGSKRGIELVLELLRTKAEEMELRVVGDVIVNTSTKEATGFSTTSYISYSNFSVDTTPFELFFNIRTGDLATEQCIASSPDYGFYLGISPAGNILLKVGEAKGTNRLWQILENRVTNVSTKLLQPNTDYYVRFSFDGVAYDVSVSTNGDSYSNYLSLESSTGLGINGGSLLIGIDGSTGNLRNPYLGIIRLGTLSVSAENVVITQWFEKFPVDIEDTYTVEADVDVNLMSANFFVKFAKFAERYVYPSLKAFKARMSLKAKVTFLPWVRQKVTYVASNLDYEGRQVFRVLQPDSSVTREDYNVVSDKPKLYAWSSSGYFVYTDTLSLGPTTRLYNRDMTLYQGSDFKIDKVESDFVVVYKGIQASRQENEDIYGQSKFLTIEDRDNSHEGSPRDQGTDYEDNDNIENSTSQNSESTHGSNSEGSSRDPGTDWEDEDID